jgi:hypothetical protein
MMTDISYRVAGSRLDIECLNATLFRPARLRRADESGTRVTVGRQHTRAVPIPEQKSPSTMEVPALVANLEQHWNAQNRNV